MQCGPLCAAQAGFQSPESIVRNVYAYYGSGSDEFSHGLPRNEETAHNFFDDSLQQTWTAIHPPPYDFFVQSPTWQLGPVNIAITLRQFDRTYVAASFTNHGKSVSLNFIVVKRPEGWLIYDVESSHDSLRMFLRQLKQ
ncbi:MAG: hypothetical protein HY242_08115 [Afipia sp.]|nr:hypothetical protein [Afipia sp.]